MKVEAFEAKQAEMSNVELIKWANTHVSELARTGGRSLRMCVPPMVTDTDMILSEVIRRFEQSIQPCNLSFEIVKEAIKKIRKGQKSILFKTWEYDIEVLRELCFTLGYADDTLK